MLENPNNDDDDGTKQQSLPVSIHPDDAKDKVFTAILKALLKMDNKPSSPKELANVIIQSDFATLGGSTPFATVSSRISQHFKRAAEHKPPRSPLLTRHVDSSHSRKINYSLAAESILPSPTPSSPDSPSPTSQKIRPQQKSKRKVVQMPSLETDDAPITRPAGQTKNRRRRIQKHDTRYIYDTKNTAKSIISTPSSSAAPASPTKSTTQLVSNPIDHTHAASTIPNSPDVTRDPKDDSPDYYQGMLNETMGTFDETSETTIHRPLLTLTIPQQQLQLQQPDTTSDPTLDYQPIDNTNTLWTNDDDFGLVHLPDSSTAHLLSFNIDAPETVPISELDDYFGNDNESSSTARSSHNTSPSLTSDTHVCEESAVSSRPLSETHSDTKDVDDTPIDTHRDSAQQIHKHQLCHSWPTSSQQTPSLYYESNSMAITTHESNWDPSNDTLSADSSQHPISDQSTEQKHYDDSQNTNNNANSTHHVINDSQQSILSSTTCIGDKCDDDIFFQYDDDTDDENDMFKSSTPAHAVQNAESTATSLNIHTLSKLLELMHANRADFTTLHQIITATPELKYLSPIIEQIKSLAVYLQQTSPNDTDSCASSSQSTTDNSALNNQQNSDINAIFTQFPALKLLLNKHHEQQNVSEKQPLSSPETILVETATLTNPTMYITVIDDTAVCVAILPSTSNTPEYRIMRRLDLDYVNGTTLLKAGGIDSEHERSVIFSLEKDRLRIRRRNSVLNGTWLPLKRAQHLAATCSIEHRLGSFLDDSIESHFPSPLPVNIVKRQQIKPISPKYHLPYSWKVDTDQETSPAVLSRDVSLIADDGDDHCTGSFWMGTTRKSLSLPGSFSATDSDTHLETGLNYSQQQKLSVAVSPSSSDKTTAFWATTDDGSTDDTTDTDSDTEKVRRQKKRDYDAAVNAMPGDTSLDDLINGRYTQNRSDTAPRQNKRRRKQQRTPSNTTNRKAPTRRRNATTAKPGMTLTPAMIRKSASWNGSIRSPHPLSSATSTQRQANQEITKYTPFSFVLAGSTNLSTFDENDDVDIGGHGYGDDLR